jgi:hypothetical protein
MRLEGRPHFAIQYNVYIYIYWLFNIAMEHCPFIDNFIGDFMMIDL